jgi:hypothetical protein
MVTEYLHCIELSDKLKNFNFCSRRVIESLLPMQLLLNDKKQNPMHMDIDSFQNCMPKDIDGLSSPRMLLIYKAALAKQLNRQLMPDEERAIKLADIEIAFEEGRRKYNYGAPSRLSCLYLADNDLDGRTMLQNMLGISFRRPLIVEVAVLNKMELVKADHRWLDTMYLNDPKEEYIQNYWTEVPLDKKPSWEYLLEGTIIMTNQQQIQEIEEHVKNEFPIYYDAIIAERTGGK